MSPEAKNCPVSTEKSKDLNLVKFAKGGLGFTGQARSLKMQRVHNEGHAILVASVGSIDLPVPVLSVTTILETDCLSILSLIPPLRRDRLASPARVPAAF